MRKPRVGIMSMQRIRNYGSFLQAYGLKRMLEELGCEVRFVDYHPGKCLIEPDKPSHLPRPIAKLAEVFEGPGPIIGKFAYANYKRHYDSKTWPLLGLAVEPDYRTDDLDMLVIGSDEVFNCVQSNPNVGFSPDLFGANSKAKRLIAYAASCGNTTIKKLQEHNVADEVAKWLKGFNAISVRDENTAMTVKELTCENPVRNLDPVLPYDFFGKESIPENPVNGKYMIVYAYSGRLSRDECVATREYADKHSLKVINVGGIQGVCDQFLDLEPFEVLAAFKNAECVLTDTFHGTILSVISERPFATIIHTQGYGNSEKLTDLLEKIGLKNHSLQTLSEMVDVLDSQIDYRLTRKIISEGRRCARIGYRNKSNSFKRQLLHARRCL